jgi:hypothetical protein
LVIPAPLLVERKYFLVLGGCLSAFLGIKHLCRKRSL